MGRAGRRKELLEFVEDMVELGAYAIREHIPGTDEALARDVAIDIANALCHRHLKRTFYVPADYEPRLMRRDEELMAALAEDSATSRRYSAGRVRELAAAYDLSERQVWNIQRQAASRAAKAARAAQMSLPIGPETPAA